MAPVFAIMRSLLAATPISPFRVIAPVAVENLATRGLRPGKLVESDVKLISRSRYIWGFPEIRGTFLGVPIIRITVFWGLHWGPPI